MAASVSTCNNSHTCILTNLLEKCFSFLLFTLTQWLPFSYNLRHRLTELNVSIFISWNWSSSKLFNEDNHMLVCRSLNWILFIQQVSLQNFLTRQDNFYNKWHKRKSRIFPYHVICYPSQLVLVTTCLGRRFRINCPRAFLKILKLPK